MAIHVLETLLRQDRTWSPAASSVVDSAAEGEGGGGQPLGKGHHFVGGGIFELLLLAHGQSRRADETSAKLAAAAKDRLALGEHSHIVVPGLHLDFQGCFCSERLRRDCSAPTVAVVEPEASNAIILDLDQVIVSKPIGLQYNKKRPPMADHHVRTQAIPITM